MAAITTIHCSNAPISWQHTLMLRAWNDISIGCALLSYAYDMDEAIDTHRVCSNDILIWLLDIARTIMHETTCYKTCSCGCHMTFLRPTNVTHKADLLRHAI